MRSLLVLTATLLALGCSSKPKAPALTASPVYRNEREGLRFMVPDLWHISSRADLPSGPVTQERLIAQYQRGRPAQPATVEVSRIDDRTAEELEPTFRKPSHGTTGWKPTKKEAPVEVSGLTGTAFRYNGQTGKFGTTKEVVVVPRGEKRFVFTAIYKDGDESAASQFQTILGSVVWE